MILELPDDHPIAEAIMAMGVHRNHVILTVESFDYPNWIPLDRLQLEVTQWTRYARSEHLDARLEVTFVDRIKRKAELEEMLRWPGEPS